MFCESYGDADEISSLSSFFIAPMGLKKFSINMLAVLVIHFPFFFFINSARILTGFQYKLTPSPVQEVTHD